MHSSASSGKAKTDGSVSVLYGTEFDEKVLFADRVVNGYLGLIPVTPNVRNHQRRLQALSGDAVKQAKIRSYHDKSGIAPDKQAEMEVKRIQEQQRRALVEKGVRYTGAMTSWRPGAAVIGSRGSSPRKRDRGGPGGGGARARGESSEEEGYDMDTGPGAKYRGGGGGYEVDDFVVEDDEDDDFLTGGDRPKKRSKSGKQASKRSRDFSDDDDDEDEDEEAQGESEEEASAEESEGEASELEQAERDAERAMAQREKAKQERRARDAPTAVVPGESPHSLPQGFPFRSCGRSEQTTSVIKRCRAWRRPRSGRSWWMKTMTSRCCRVLVGRTVVRIRRPIDGTGQYM